MSEQYPKASEQCLVDSSKEQTPWLSPKLETFASDKNSVEGGDASLLFENTGGLATS